MNTSSFVPIKVVALITALIFCSNQIVFAAGDFLLQESSSITPPARTASGSQHLSI